MTGSGRGPFINEGFPRRFCKVEPVGANNKDLSHTMSHDTETLMEKDMQAYKSQGIMV